MRKIHVKKNEQNTSFVNKQIKVSDISFSKNIFSRVLSQANFKLYFLEIWLLVQLKLAVKDKVIS